VKNHRGAIHIDSDPARGTVVALFLPLVEDAVPQEGQSPPAAAGTAVRLLLIDDEQMILEYTTEGLRDLGYAVTACRDPEKAVALYRAEWSRIDLVILDMVMPRMSGREVFQAIKAINPAVRVLLASGYSVDGEAGHILDEGVRGFIQKPFRVDELSARIEELLR
jgi:DNA-binding response OmpR family regulator